MFKLSTSLECTIKYEVQVWSKSSSICLVWTTCAQNSSQIRSEGALIAWNPDILLWGTYNLHCWVSEVVLDGFQGINNNSYKGWMHA